ncbi:helix-turn-helix transcriptional regulator [Cohnella abietis]|uniref:helix-turn-helix transcriptional regulator n=1 Tax=Cohnella abietis TaxID=2507935 RepID=UPI001E490854|nr:AraC family transcriptional regulator [Cohnella abietis]
MNYNLPDLPLYVRKGSLNQFNNYAAAAHWHLDIEFIYVLKGAMDFSVNGHITRIEQGHGIFVNSRRIHFGFSHNHFDCLFIVVVIHPALLGEGVSPLQTYWNEKFSQTTDDFVLLTNHVAWQQSILLSLQAIYDEMHDSHSPNPLSLASQALALCALTGDHLQRKVGQSEDINLWTNVQKMTHFIRQHYEKKITLEDIASAGTVCKSRCCTLFNKFVGQTPNTYLTRYRIQKSCEMLKETKRSISEIALACGFQSGSYFTSIFRKQLGLVPQDYRKQSK